jgi:hypothetical protein
MIENSIMEYLVNVEGLNAWKNDNIGLYDKQRKSYRSSKWGRKGVSDIILTMDIEGIPVTIWLEVKKPNGQISKDQREFKKSLGNGFYYVVRSVSDVKEAIREVQIHLNDLLDSMLH